MSEQVLKELVTEVKRLQAKEGDTVIVYVPAGLSAIMALERAKAIKAMFRKTGYNVIVVLDTYRIEVLPKSGEVVVTED